MFRAMERNIFRFALVAELGDFGAGNFSGVIIFHRRNAFPRLDGSAAEFLVRGKERSAFQHNFSSHRKHGFGRGQKKN
jgi:hypothetical protein